MLFLLLKSFKMLETLKTLQHKTTPHLPIEIWLLVEDVLKKLKFKGIVEKLEDELELQEASLRFFDPDHEIWILSREFASFGMTYKITYDNIPVSDWLSLAEFEVEIWKPEFRRQRIYRRAWNRLSWNRWGELFEVYL